MHIFFFQLPQWIDLYVRFVGFFVVVFFFLDATLQGICVSSLSMESKDNALTCIFMLWL